MVRWLLVEMLRSHEIVLLAEMVRMHEMVDGYLLECMKGVTCWKIIVFIVIIFRYC